jgi:hypothetical protein
MSSITEHSLLDFQTMKGPEKSKNAGKTLAVQRFLEHCTAVTQHICEIAEKSPQQHLKLDK